MIRPLTFLLILMFGTPLFAMPVLPQALQDQFALKYQQRGSSYQPRTRHKNPDGSAQYTNRLFLETSPYLLQHAHNPVNWYPWGDAAFTAAKKLNRPILLSIGYSTCHWCHVMEEESFEDLAIARFINQHYIAIKVDREERPDIDAIYMRVVQALTGRGGWPMTVWLMPDRKPFYAATYLPARDGDRGVNYGFLTLLKKLHGLYQQQPKQVANAGDALTKAIQQQLKPEKTQQIAEATLITKTPHFYQQRFDEYYGGLEGAPKFPSSFPNRLFLRAYRHHSDKKLLNQVALTLEKMADGGIYDHLGGGFHRYSTDESWLVPHFEKMLYDNALLALTYLEAFQVTNNPRLQQIVKGILGYVTREMTSAQGGFYSATDADSLNAAGEREEGWFFTWTKTEVEKALDPKIARLFEAYYQMTSAGNFEGRNILHTPEPLAEVAKRLQLTPLAAATQLASAKDQLYNIRAKRPTPGLDNKILTAWNGLMISAYAKAGFMFADPRLLDTAKQAATFILSHLIKQGQLYRSYNEGEAKHPAYLMDYANLIAGLLDLYEATAEISWLKHAIQLDSVLALQYEDKIQGGFWLTRHDHEALLSKEKPINDGAQPSGNAIAILNLLRLHEITFNDAYRQRAVKALQLFSQTLKTQPFSHTDMLLALDFYHDESKAVIIVTSDKSKQSAAPFMQVLRKHFVPNKVVILVAESDIKQQTHVIPALKGKRAMNQKTTAYVCEHQVCKLPTQDPAVFAKQLINRL